jgi:hypothetical protein
MNQPSRKGYPLGALFVLVAFCGVLAALAAPLGRAISSGVVSGADVALAALAGAPLAALVGAAIGIHQMRWILGGLLGLAVGAVVGAACGPLVLIPASGFPSLLFASIGGSVVMIGVGAAMRWGSGN